MALEDEPDLSERLARVPTSDHLRLVPIRHHSPACARQLGALIRRERPNRILIEGPADADPLLPYLAANDARPPLALYCYEVRPGAAGENGRYRCFYPLAEFSPEWVAIREGSRLGADLRFIDLPFGARLGEADGTEAKDAEEPSWFGEEPLWRAAINRNLIERSGCRDFNEWWDRHFEAAGLTMEPDLYFQRLLLWCLTLRDPHEPADAETTARERAMAAAIAAATKDSQGRVLAVLGGFHVEAVAALLGDMPASLWPQTARETGGVHLMPYSLERLDRANGYGAGMSDVGYYQMVWRNRARKDPHSEAITVLATRAARELQARGDSVALPDAIEAVAMAQRLGALRGCPAGRPELLDGMTAAFAKDLHLPERFAAELPHLLAEPRIGRLPAGYPVSPLVADFRQRCRQLRLPTGPGEARERVLDIYRSARHRQQSRFLHQLRFLSVAYGVLEQGPDFTTGTDLDRVREVWRLQWQPELEARLTECSHYGADVQEAAAACLTERLARDQGNAPQLLIEALRMGLHPLFDRILVQVGRWVAREGDFAALVTGLAKLQVAVGAREVLGARNLPALSELLGAGLEQACRRLLLLGEPESDRLDAYAEALLVLNGLMPEPGADRMFVQVLAAVERTSPEPLLAGRACGLLAVRRAVPMANTLAAFARACAAASAWPVRLGEFLRGFVPPARAALLQEPPLAALLSQEFLAWSELRFLFALPHLRLAFSALNRQELRSLGEVVALLLAKPVRADSYTLWDEAATAEMTRLAATTRALLESWGLGLPTQSPPPTALTVAPPLDPDSPSQGPQLYALGPEQRRELLRRWRLILGEVAADELTRGEAGPGDQGAGGARLVGEDAERDRLLAFLYDREQAGRSYGEQCGAGLGPSRLTVPRWLDGVRTLFPRETAETLERQALDRYGLTELLTDPEALARAPATIEMVGILLRFRSRLKASALAEARRLIARVVAQLEARFARRVRNACAGTRRRHGHRGAAVLANLDWRTTITRNLRHFDLVSGTLVPERLWFWPRRLQELPWEIVILVDQSGSMLDSVIHSAVLATVFSGLRSLRTRLLLFDTTVVDLTDRVGEPVELLLGVQLGGGTDIAGAVAYAARQVRRPRRTLLVLISDFFEGGDADALVASVGRLHAAGVTLLGLAALDDRAEPDYDRVLAGELAAAGMDIGAMTPEQLANWVGDCLAGRRWSARQGRVAQQQ